MKENKRKKTYKKILLGVILIIGILILITYKFNYRRNISCAETEELTKNIKISQSEKIDLEKIIEENQKEKISEKVTTKEEDIEYITEYHESDEIPNGSIQVLQEGRVGKKEIITSEKYKNQELIEKSEIKNYLKISPINRIVEVGKNKNYKLQILNIGDKVRTSANQNNIMSFPRENSEKLTTLGKNEEIKILGTEDNWCKIYFEGIEGYIKKENIEKSITKDNLEYKNGKREKINFDMRLNKPSGLTKEEFEKILKDPQDINGTFKNNAKYFYYVEKQYSINGVFLAAVAIHESNWGKSKIALQKHNLFGYGAYDSNPYNGAYEFKEYSESIDLIARVLVKYYLNPKGTEIFNGEKAQGSYYNGANLMGINKKYASDRNWANLVYRHMKYLYDKL